MGAGDFIEYVCIRIVGCGLIRDRPPLAACAEWLDRIPRFTCLGFYVTYAPLSRSYREHRPPSSLLVRCPVESALSAYIILYYRLLCLSIGNSVRMHRGHLIACSYGVSANVFLFKDGRQIYIKSLKVGSNYNSI